MAASIERESTTTSINRDTEQTIVLKKPPGQCKIRYRLRKVSSKGALLVLFWTMLINSAVGSPNISNGALISIVVDNMDSTSSSTSIYMYLHYALPMAAWLVTAIVSGWIADTKLGNYKTVKLGLILLFFATVLDCILAAIQNATTTKSTEDWFLIVHLIPQCTLFIGHAMVMVSSLQLGLDQMPDASSENITSFIAWFVFFASIGVWIYEVTLAIPQHCLTREDEVQYKPAQHLLPVLFLSIALCSDFFLTPKWLLKMSTSSQCFTLFYQVLKFAAKHKAPLNRSALTYWEEDIPSRLDLGKSRYGGPFSTEQVEDVKTTLKMLLVSTPMPLIVLSLYLFEHILEYFEIFTNGQTNYFDLTECERTTIEQTITNPSLWTLLFIVLFEFAVYPFLVKWIPSSLKRIGIGSLFTVLVSSVALILSGVGYANGNDLGTDKLWLQLPQSILQAAIAILLYTGVLEFVFAQTPHNLKGFMIGYTWCMYSVSSILAALIFSVLINVCEDSSYCLLVFCSIVTGISITGFVLFSLLACCYKKRVRQETHTPHIWAEEVYARYLSSSQKK